MEDTKITFKTAKLAKEKGWNGDFVESHKIFTTQWMLTKWLREKYNIHIEISKNNYNKLLNWSFDLHKLPVGIKQMWERGDSTYNTYEEALEAGLYQALILL